MKNLIKSLDFFPKTDALSSENSFKGGIATIIIYLASFVLVIFEIWKYILLTDKDLFFINNDLQSDIEINLDISIACECSSLMVIEKVGGNVTVVSDSLSMQIENDHWFPEDESSDRSHRIGCRIKAKNFRLSKTVSSLAIVPIYLAAGAFQSIIIQNNPELLNVNFSHHIHELNFGSLNSKHNHVLTGNLEDSLTSYDHFSYFISLFGSLSKKSKELLYEYSYIGFKREGGPSKDNRPGLWFHLDYEPILKISHGERGDFFEFLVNMLGVLSGFFTTSRFLHEIIISFFSLSSSAFCFGKFGNTNEKVDLIEDSEFLIEHKVQILKSGHINQLEQVI